MIILLAHRPLGGAPPGNARPYPVPAYLTYRGHVSATTASMSAVEVPQEVQSPFAPRFRDRTERKVHIIIMALLVLVSRCRGRTRCASPFNMAPFSARIPFAGTIYFTRSHTAQGMRATSLGAFSYPRPVSGTVYVARTMSPWFHSCSHPVAGTAHVVGPRARSAAGTAHEVEPVAHPKDEDERGRSCCFCCCGCCSCCPARPVTRTAHSAGSKSSPAFFLARRSRT